MRQEGITSAGEEPTVGEKRPTGILMLPEGQEKEDTRYAGTCKEKPPSCQQSFLGWDGKLESEESQPQGFGTHVLTLVVFREVQYGLQKLAQRSPSLCEALGSLKRKLKVKKS